MSGGVITFRHKGGDFSKTLNYFQRLKDAAQLKILDKYGQMGVDALASATPVDTGLTANSWYYEVETHGTGGSIVYYNSNIENGNFAVAINLQYGHGTGTGGWVAGRDYINPAIQPVFDRLVKEAWEEVVRI